MLKSYRVGWWGGGVVAHEIEGPLVLGFWVFEAKGLGHGLDNKWNIALVFFLILDHYRGTFRKKMYFAP